MIPDEITTSALYVHPHSRSAAEDLLSTGQFSHCKKCKSTTCPVNILYCRLFASVYFFVQRVRTISETRAFGVGHILSYSRTKFVIENFCHPCCEYNGFINGYSIRSEINLVFETDKLDNPTEPSGKYTFKSLTPTRSQDIQIIIHFLN